MDKERINAAWLSTAPKEQHEDLRKYILSCQPLLDRLALIAKRKINASRKSSTGDYDSPGWPYRQADKTGYERAWGELLALVNSQTTEVHDQ